MTTLRISIWPGPGAFSTVSANSKSPRAGMPSGRRFSRISRLLVAAISISLLQGASDAVSQTYQIGPVNGEGRCQIDDRAKGPDPDALGDQTAFKRVQIVYLLQFNNADGTFDANIDNPRQVPARFELCAQGRFNRRDLRQARLGLKKIKRGIGSGTAERIG